MKIRVFIEVELMTFKNVFSEKLIRSSYTLKDIYIYYKNSKSVQANPHQIIKNRNYIIIFDNMCLAK